jgi:NAD(P)-dependent dehydrogenase (short-subunit alcohol dehydrogenase family)
MITKFPNVVVVYGSESQVLRETIDWLLQCHCKIIRIYKHSVPKAHKDCVDINDIQNLAPTLLNLNKNLDESLRIAFIGAAFARQNTLMMQQSNIEFDNAIQTNIISYVKISQTLLSEMIKNKYGKFIYLSSFRAEHSNPGAILYGASKAFGEQYFSGLGREYGRFNVVTSCIRMGYFDSGMIDEYSESIQDQVRKSISLGRLGTGSDLLKAVQFIFGSEYVNSGIIELNGGLRHE